MSAGEGHDTLCQAVLAHLGPDDLLLRGGPGAASAGIDESWLRDRDAKGGRAAAYICRGTQCSLPVTDTDALADIAEFRFVAGAL